MRIDVHAHYWAASYIDALAEAGRPELGHAKQKDDLDSRLAEMDRVGVDLQIFSAVGLNVEVADPAKAASVARHMNDLYAEIATKYDNRFSGFASVPLPHVEESIVESNRALDELGLAGIALPCIVGGKPIDHEDYEPFWKNLGERGAVIYVHPQGMDSSGHPGLSDYHLNMALGSPMQIAMAPLRIGLSGLSTRYPKLEFVFALCGGILPYVWDRYDLNLQKGFNKSVVAAVGSGFFAWMDGLPIEPDDPMKVFRRFWFDTSVQDIPIGLKLSRDVYGAHQIVLGSDAIFASLTAAVEMIEGSPDLTDEEKHLILDVNAERMLHQHFALPAVGAPAR